MHGIQGSFKKEKIFSTDLVRLGATVFSNGGIWTGSWEGVRDVVRILHVRLVVFEDVSCGCAKVVRLERLF